MTSTYKNWKKAIEKTFFKIKIALGLCKTLTRREIAVAKSLIGQKDFTIFNHQNNKEYWVHNEWALETLACEKKLWLFSPEAIKVMLENGHFRHFTKPQDLTYFFQNNTECLHVLGQCDDWLDEVNAINIADACHHAPEDALETASYLLARKADRLLIQEQFRTYAHIISHFVLKGNYGIYCWAVKEGLPIVDYTPVSERLSELYDFGQLSSDCFRITYLIGCAQSAHEKLSLVKFLNQQPGPSWHYLRPEKYLAFRQQCSNLIINRQPQSY